MRMESNKQNHAKFPSLDYPAIRFILLAISRAGTVDFLNKRREVSSRVLEIVCLFVRGVFVQNVRSSVVQSGSVHKPLQKILKTQVLTAYLQFVSEGMLEQTGKGVIVILTVRNCNATSPGRRGPVPEFGTRFRCLRVCLRLKVQDIPTICK